MFNHTCSNLFLCLCRLLIKRLKFCRSHYFTNNLISIQYSTSNMITQVYSTSCQLILVGCCNRFIKTICHFLLWIHLPWKSIDSNTSSGCGQSTQYEKTTKTWSLLLHHCVLATIPRTSLGVFQQVGVCLRWFIWIQIHGCRQNGHVSIQVSRMDSYCISQSCWTMLESDDIFDWCDNPTYRHYSN